MKRIGISIGDINGIGPEITLKAVNRIGGSSGVRFVVIGSETIVREQAAALNIPVSPEIEFVDVAAKAKWVPGEVCVDASLLAEQAIRCAVSKCLSGELDALVTAPIHKGALYHAGFRHPGHTEFLAELCAQGGKPPLPVMMLAHGGLRAVPLTIHVPLRDVPGLLSHELIVKAVRIVAQDLKQRFGIARPQIAVAGLNPHAGEGGGIGREEIDMIGPAVAQLQAEGVGVTGPLPADTLFYPSHWARYDAVVAMYHDQALIPIKTVAFDEAVNVTLGLPIVRTSPDHGTAFDLAGTGKASPASTRAALDWAARLAARKNPWAT